MFSSIVCVFSVCVKPECGWVNPLGCPSGPPWGGRVPSGAVRAGAASHLLLAGPLRTLWGRSLPQAFACGASVSIQALLTSEHLREQHGQGHVGGGELYAEPGEP